MELINADKAQNKRKIDRLLIFKDAIKEARLRNFSFIKIANYLKSAGFDVSKYRVRHFCVEILNEKPIRKRRNKADLELEKIMNSLTLTQPRQNSVCFAWAERKILPPTAFI